MFPLIHRHAPPPAPPAASPAVKAPLFIARRPREGFREYRDRLDADTVRMGETTFAKRRERGVRHGAMRPPKEG